MTDGAQPSGFGRYRLQAREMIDNPGRMQKVYLETVKKADSKKTDLGGVWSELKSLTRLVRAWINGSYRDVSTQTKVLVLGGLLYFLSPIDLVPDFIAGLGLLDDAALIGWIVSSLRGDLRKFRGWEDVQYPDF